MLSSRNKAGTAARSLAWGFVLVALLVLVGGCIADTAADSDLPWATNQGWEGMSPIRNAMQYD